MDTEILRNPLLWLVIGGGGLLGFGIAMGIFINQMLRALYAKAEEKQDELEQILQEIRELAQEVRDLSQKIEPTSPEENRILQSLQESLDQLPRYRDPEARYEEEAFLQVAVSLALEVLHRHEDQLGEEERKALARCASIWKRLDVDVDRKETGYNQVATQYNGWLRTFPVNLFAFWTGMKPLPLFELAGDVKGAFAHAFQQGDMSMAMNNVMKNIGGEKEKRRKKGDKKRWDDS